MTKNKEADIQEKVADYISVFSNFLENKTLNRLKIEHLTRENIHPSIGEDSANIIYWLIRSFNLRKIVEFGSCLGYSTIVLAEAAKATNGHLYSIEVSADMHNETKKNLIEANLLRYATLINGDAKTEFESLEGPFDFILQDSKKSLYPIMLETCINKLRSGGLLVADDTLFSPYGKPQNISKHMDKYNELVFNDDRLISSIIPVKDGLTISYKK